MNRSQRLTLCLACPILLAACDSTMPSTRFSNGVKLPVPSLAVDLPGPERLTRQDQGEAVRLTPRTLISIAFDNQPDIKSSYQRFKSEEARYDFFVVSRDSLTPQFSTSNTFRESRDKKGGILDRGRDHTVELGVEKQFFDTTELNVGVGLRTEDDNDELGSQPFVSANLRYPLWVSRRRLQRTSEEIFRRNELNDAQLGYIQQVRRRLERALDWFYEVVWLRQQIANARSWKSDLISLLDGLAAVAGRDVSADRNRLDAEISRISAQLSVRSGRSEVVFERLKAACGLAFHVRADIVDEPFNPFKDSTHDELFRLGISTDPEIATLRNEQRNAEVQLDLARRGRWDVQLLLDATSSLEGGGKDDGVSDWSASVGVDVSAVDPRVTDSLSRQAEARIRRFQQAIIARENDIFVNVFEPLVRIDTLGASRAELQATLPRFRQDFDTGIREFFAGTLNVDDLLTRRETLYQQEQEIARLTFIMGANVAELCAATGKFFELLIEDGNELTQP